MLSIIAVVRSGVKQLFAIVASMQLTLILFGIMCVYLIINIARLFKGRLNKEYLRHAVKKTAQYLILFQLIIIALAALGTKFELNLTTGLYILVSTQLIVAISIFASTLLNIKKSSQNNINTSIQAKDLPSLTVCIPARNETQDLEECLRSLISCTYPKLEILVLDDCSQERRTPEIIKSFAQQGVRFIAGKAPPETWLAKNYGYDQLADEANGEILLFCGVDSRFEPETITKLVSMMVQSNKTMMSIMPRNILSSDSSFSKSLVQPSRYAWELCLPRKLFNRPPVLSSCWLIDKNQLESAGGFNAISRKAVPESYFAKLASDAYGFVISDKTLGLVSQKSFTEQRATAIRNKYPQLHRRPEWVVLLSIALLTQMVIPYGIMFGSVISGATILGLISLLVILFNTLIFSIIFNLTYRRFLFSGIFLLPVAAIYDLCLLNYSMWQYEFGEVIWKDRNICIPIMQVVPELPKI
jgi:glycosyltransferase involved in cell wall biosynthesis